MSYNDWMNFRARFKALILTKNWKTSFTKEQRATFASTGKAYNTELQKQNLDTITQHLNHLQESHEEIGWLESEADSLITKINTLHDSFGDYTQELIFLNQQLLNILTRIEQLSASPQEPHRN